MNRKSILLIIWAVSVCGTAMASPTVTSEQFGRLIPDKKVKIYTLTNDNGVEAKLIPFGAVLVSLKVPDANGNFADVVLGYNRFVEYVRDKYYFGCAVGQFGKQLYKAGTFKNKYSCGIVFSFTSSDANKLNVKVKYTLTNDNEIQIEYEAKAGRKTIVNLTNHSYFNLAGQGIGNILNHNMMINADYYIPDVNGIPTGEVRQVENAALDFRTPIPIGTNIKKVGGFNHHYILNKASPGELSLAAKVAEPNSGRVLEVFTTAPAVLFNSCNLDKPVRGKWGSVYKKYSAFRLSPESPSAILKPGDVYRQTTTYKFSVQR